MARINKDEEAKAAAKAERAKLRSNAEARVAIAQTAGIVVGGCVLYALVPMVGPHWWMGMLTGVIALVVIVPVTVRRLLAINRSLRPIIDAVEAVVLLLTMLALGFATAYVVLNDRPGQMSGISTKIDALYFSVTTLTTVGYGDIHATGQGARLVVTVQMVIDLVFIAATFKLIGGVARDRAAQLKQQGELEELPELPDLP